MPADESTIKLKKARRSDKDGVRKVKNKSTPGKTGDAAVTTATTATLLQRLESDPDGSEDVTMRGPPPIGVLVPFANPLADDKVQKKVLKSVTKAAKNRSIKRGVKEVVKCLRKSAVSAVGQLPLGVVILAADISPMDVISHIPVLCEDKNIPYLYIRSRAELGAAGSTKRPTSVVLIHPDRVGKKKVEQPDAERAEFADVYRRLVKVVDKESRQVRI